MTQYIAGTIRVDRLFIIFTRLRIIKVEHCFIFLSAMLSRFETDIVIHSHCLAI